MPAFDAPPPLGRAKEHSVFAQNQTRLGCLRRQEGPRNCAALPRSTRRLGTPAGSARISATLVHLAGGIRPASAEARGAIEHAATTHHHGAETIVPAPEDRKST